MVDDGLGLCGAHVGQTSCVGRVEHRRCRGLGTGGVHGPVFGGGRLRRVDLVGHAAWHCRLDLVVDRLLYDGWTLVRVEWSAGRAHNHRYNLGHLSMGR